MRTSRLLSELTGEPVQANKAIVGRNAFAHEAGIHQHGLIKDRRTYEIMRPVELAKRRKPVSEAAIGTALDDGCRTADLVAPGEPALSCTVMTTAIVERIK